MAPSHAAGNVASNTMGRVKAAKSSQAIKRSSSRPKYSILFSQRFSLTIASVDPARAKKWAILADIEIHAAMFLFCVDSLLVAFVPSPLMGEG
jgi:hypothetical protein